MKVSSTSISSLSQSLQNTSPQPTSRTSSELQPSSSIQVGTVGHHSPQQQSSYNSTATSSHQSVVHQQGNNGPVYQNHQQFQPPTSQTPYHQQSHYNYFNQGADVASNQLAGYNNIMNSPPSLQNNMLATNHMQQMSDQMVHPNAYPYQSSYYQPGHAAHQGSQSSYHAQDYNVQTGFQGSNNQIDPASMSSSSFSQPQNTSSSSLDMHIPNVSQSTGQMQSGFEDQPSTTVTLRNVSSKSQFFVIENS